MNRPRPAVLLAVGLGLAAVDVALLFAFDRSTVYGIRLGVDFYVLQVTLVLAYLVGGYAATRLRPGNRTGVLMLWVGVVVAGNSSAGFPLLTEAWPMVALRSITVLFVPLQWAVLTHLVLAYPTGTLRDRVAATTVRAYYAAALIGPAISIAGNHRPLCDGCPPAVGLGLIPTATAMRLLTFDVTLWMLLLAAGLVMFARQYRRASARERRIMRYPATAIGIGGLVVLAFLAQGLLTRAFDIRVQVPLASVMEAVGAIVLPAGFLLGLVRERLDQAKVADLVRHLAAAPPQELGPALAAALGDPDAQLVYAAASGYVDHDGRPVVATTHQQLSAAGEPERPVAYLLHDRSLAAQPQLVEAVGNAVALALDNARLHAQVVAQLAEVNASRARIVAAAADARRKLERDLHDGAQQRLISIGLVLQLMRRQLQAADPDTVALLEETEQHARSAITELRELARGIHPAVLTEQGLAAAVEQLALRCPVPVRLQLAPVDRLPASIEATAYFVVNEALANVVKHSDATAASVTVRCADGRLHVQVTDDGTGGAVAAPGSGLSGLADRAAAVAGSLTVADLPGGGTSVVADLPCTSHGSS